LRLRFFLDIGMRKLFKWTFRIFAVGAVVLGLFLWQTWSFKPLTPNLFYARTFAKFAVDSPEMLSSMRILPGWMDWYSDDLADRSMARETVLDARTRSELATLRSYPRASLQDQTSYDVLEFFLANAVEGQAFRFHSYPLNQMSGEQSGLPTFMATQHAVSSVGEGDDYLARLAQFPRAFDQVLEGLMEREKRKIFPPTFVVEKVLVEMRGFVGVAPTENILYTSLQEKLRKAGASIPPAEQTRLLAATATAIRTQIYPTYQKLISYYETLLPKTTGNNGVWALPDGDRYYQYCIKSRTTTDMTAEQVHALGLAEVARIEQEMVAILRSEGLTEGSIGARVKQISSRPDQLYPDSDAGRQQILADYQKIIDEVNAGLSPYFNVRPKESVRVERIPVFKEKTSPGAYYDAAAFDGSRPGVFYANLRTVSEIPRFSMRTLAYHEAIPGHHFQIDVQQHITGVPFFRKLVPFTAFAEGWALYAEQLAWEAGFQAKPLDNLGRLQAEMFRAVRLVVDSGLHSKHWTREQAITYMLDYTGMPEGDVVAEIERYLVWPGQALAYKVGMMKILELRTRAKTALGAKFDIKAFHDQVLTGGSLPLRILEQKIDAWIASQTATGLSKS
jgi:uncharacterized protein (DUF885 family)